MNCTEAHRFLQAYIDNELDVADTLKIEYHLETCVTCREKYNRYLALRDALQQNSQYFTAPQQLRQHVLSALRQRERAAFVARATSSWRGLGIAAAACLIVVALAVVLSGLWRGVSIPAPLAGGEPTLQQQVFDNHMRSLMADHLVDIRSSDPDSIKPWFKGKLNYSPYIYDLSANGYSLVGGRLDYLDNRAVAAIVYKYEGHIINFFLWPTDQNTTPLTMSTIQNYHLAAWREERMNCWAISDITQQDMQKFVYVLQAW